MTNPLEKKETALENYEGVSITIEHLSKAEFDQTLFYVTWHNETDKEIICGETFTVEYKSGEEWIAVGSEKAVSPYPLYGETGKKSYIAQNLDLSKCGLYRLVIPFSIKDGDKSNSYHAWAEFNVTSMPNVDVDDLRKKCPQYFGLDASNGLDVYVWQMAPYNYLFGLLPHFDQNRDWLNHDLMALKPVSAEQMNVILSTYDIKESDIHVHAWYNPVSSYFGNWQLIRAGEDPDEKRQAYEESIRRMIFGTWPNSNQK